MSVQPHKPTRSLYYSPETFDKISDWTAEWGLGLNKDKSQHMTFALRPGNNPTVSILSKDLTQVQHVTYLGVHKDRHLTWNKHLRRK